MKRLLVPFFAVMLIILSTTAIALADNGRDGSGGMMDKGERSGFMMGSTSTTTIGGKGHMGELKQDLQEKRQELKTKFDDFRKQKINSMIGMLKQRFVAAIDRLNNIADRIETRISKIETQNGTTLTDARNFLKDARGHLDDARTALDGIGTTTATLFNDTTSTGERFGHLHTLFADAKQAIQAARQSLMNALRATGQWHGSDDKATSTEE